MSIIDLIGAMAKDAREASRHLRKLERAQKDHCLKLMARAKRHFIPSPASLIM